MSQKLRRSGNEILNRNGFPILPYLDPQFNPNHPLNNPPHIEEDPYLPMSKQQRQRLEKEAMERALRDYLPPHVPRSWEHDSSRAYKRAQILSLTLPPKDSRSYSDLLPHRHMPVPDTDFRRFASIYLHLNYHRFHAFGEDAHEVDIPEDPNDICWIMEYTETECNAIRRKLAFALGEFPAVIDPKLTIYNEEIASRYHRRLYSRCRRRERRCIRPSHIEIFTSSFDVLP